MGLVIMQHCQKCNKPQYRLRWDKGVGVGTDCGCTLVDHSADSVNSPYFELTLDHVFDEKGNKVRVDSLRQMSKVEERYGVIHACTSYSENYIQPDQKQHTFQSGLYRGIAERRREMSESQRRTLRKPLWRP